MPKSTETKEFDSRMVEWNLKHNVITREQLKSYLNSLPDEAANSEPLKIDDSGEPVVS